MTAKIVNKDTYNLLIEWEDNQKGFGQLSIKWDNDKKIYLLDSEFMGIDSILEIIKAAE